MDEVLPALRIVRLPDRTPLEAARDLGQAKLAKLLQAEASAAKVEELRHAMRELRCCEVRAAAERHSQLSARRGALTQRDRTLHTYL